MNLNLVIISLIIKRLNFSEETQSNLEVKKIELPAEVEGQNDNAMPLEEETPKSSVLELVVDAEKAHLMDEPGMVGHKF